MAPISELSLSGMPPPTIACASRPKSPAASSVPADAPAWIGMPPPFATPSATPRFSPRMDKAASSAIARIFGSRFPFTPPKSPLSLNCRPWITRQTYRSRHVRGRRWHQHSRIAQHRGPLWRHRLASGRRQRLAVGLHLSARTMVRGDRLALWSRRLHCQLLRRAGLRARPRHRAGRTRQIALGLQCRRCHARHL